MLTADPASPRQARERDLAFDRGRPVSLNGSRLKGWELDRLNVVAARRRRPRNGREPPVGMKSRLYVSAAP
jgi:hypothetical protein